MNYTIKLVAFLGITGILVSGCYRDYHCIRATGPLLTQDVEVDPFTGIDLQIAADVTLIQGAVQEVTAIGQEDILEDLETKVVNGVWLIQLDEDKCYKYDELLLTITLPDLDQVLLTGSGDIDIQDFTDQGDLQLRILGSGDIDIQDFEGAENLLAGIYGSGTITGHGALPDLEELSVEITGSGNYRGFSIETIDAGISITGSGNCEVFVSDNLAIFIGGSGNVFYKGNPNVISTTITGSGEVIDAN